MTSSTQAAQPVATPERESVWSRHDLVVLAIAPLVLAVGRLILVPYDDQEWDRVLTDMAANHSRNAIGWALTLIAAALLSAAGLALVRLLPHRSRLVLPAAIGVVLGWTGTAGIATGGLIMGDMANVPERTAMVAVLTNFNEGNGNTIFFLVLAGVLGNILLAIALARGAIVSKGVAVLLGLSAVVSLVGSPGPVKAIAVTGAVMLIGAHFLILRSLSGFRTRS
ncbi:MAG: hypothetical protein ABIP17_10090 [Ilumatobacteraceae bacterium]